MKESSTTVTGSGNKEEANEAGATGLPTDTAVTDEHGVTGTDKALVDVTSSADARVGKGEPGVTGTDKASVDVTSSADARVGKGEPGVTGTDKASVDVTSSADARVGKGEPGVTGTDKASVDVTSSADARVGKGEHSEGAQEIELPSIGNFKDILAATCDFQHCGILTCVDSDEHVQHPFKLTNSKSCSVSS